MSIIDAFGSSTTPRATLLTTSEVAQRFGRTPRTIRNWVRDGYLRPVRIGCSVFFNEAEVDHLAMFGTHSADESEVV